MWRVGKGVGGPPRTKGLGVSMVWRKSGGMTRGAKIRNIDTKRRETSGEKEEGKKKGTDDRQGLEKRAVGELKI